jgi:hypothetical protein
MSKAWPPKGPHEVLNYGFDWSPRELGSAIDSTTCVVKTGDVVVESHDQGPVEDAPAGSGTITILSGGTLGSKAVLYLTVTTVDDLFFDQLVTIKIQERT